MSAISILQKTGFNLFIVIKGVLRQIYLKISIAIQQYTVILLKIN